MTHYKRGCFEHGAHFEVDSLGTDLTGRTPAEHLIEGTQAEHEHSLGTQLASTLELVDDPGLDSLERHLAGGTPDLTEGTPVGDNQSLAGLDSLEHFPVDTLGFHKLAVVPGIP